MTKEEIIKKIEELEETLYEMDDEEEFYKETRKNAKKLNATLEIFSMETGLTKQELVQMISAVNGGTIINNNILEKEGN